jgi:hypothetical protein
MNCVVKMSIVSLLCSSLDTEAKRISLNLQEALERKLVTAQARSLGGHSGHCISISLKSRTKDSLVVKIEQGRRLKPVDADFQDILVVKGQLVKLRSGEEKTVRVKGYCCEADDNSPSANVQYQLNGMADSMLTKLARFLDANAFASGAEQQAVWALSNKRPTGAISSDSLTLPLKRFVAGLKGERLPWYSIDTRSNISSSGRINMQSLGLRGSIPYSLERTEYVTCYILDEKLMPVGIIKSDWLSAAQNGSYELDVPVRALAGGKYTVELRTADGLVAKSDFEL